MQSSALKQNASRKVYLKTIHNKYVLSPKTWQHLREITTDNLIIQIFHSFIKYFLIY